MKQRKVEAKLKNLSKREVKDMKLMLQTFVIDKTPRHCQVYISSGAEISTTCKQHVPKVIVT